MDEFARQWTYRSPLKTVTYPKGHVEALPADVLKAAREADVLVVEPPVEAIVDTPTEQKPKRAKKPE